MPARTRLRTTLSAPCLVRREDEHALHGGIGEDALEQRLLLRRSTRTSRSARRCSTVVATGVTATCTGSVSSEPASSAIVFGMVAEKNSVCRFAGTSFTIFLSGTMKPRSSIWSASSTTRISTRAERQQPLLDEVEQPARRGDENVDAALQRIYLRALRHAAEDDGDGEPQPRAVGAKALRDLARELARRRQHQHARPAGNAGRARSGESRSRIGSANAAVLPVPVCAMPQRSRPARIGEMACAWIGVGVLWPSFGNGAKNGFAKGEIGKLGQMVLSVMSKPGGARNSRARRSGVVRRPA